MSAIQNIEIIYNKIEIDEETFKTFSSDEIARAILKYCLYRQMKQDMKREECFQKTYTGEQLIKFLSKILKRYGVSEQLLELVKQQFIPNRVAYRKFIYDKRNIIERIYNKTQKIIYEPYNPGHKRGFTKNVVTPSVPVSVPDSGSKSLVIESPRETEIVPVVVAPPKVTPMDPPALVPARSFNLPSFKPFFLQTPGGKSARVGLTEICTKMIGVSGETKDIKYTFAERIEYEDGDELEVFTTTERLTAPKKLGLEAAYEDAAWKVWIEYSRTLEIICYGNKTNVGQGPEAVYNYIYMLPKFITMIDDDEKSFAFVHGVAKAVVEILEECQREKATIKKEAQEKIKEIEEAKEERKLTGKRSRKDSSSSLSSDELEEELLPPSKRIAASEPVFSDSELNIDAFVGVTSSPLSEVKKSLQQSTQLLNNDFCEIQQFLRLAAEDPCEEEQISSCLMEGGFCYGTPEGDITEDEIMSEEEEEKVTAIPPPKVTATPPPKVTATPPPKEVTAKIVPFSKEDIISDLVPVTFHKQFAVKLNKTANVYGGEIADFHCTPVSVDQRYRHIGKYLRLPAVQAAKKIKEQPEIFPQRDATAELSMTNYVAMDLIERLNERDQKFEQYCEIDPTVYKEFRPNHPMKTHYLFGELFEYELAQHLEEDEEGELKIAEEIKPFNITALKGTAMRLKQTIDISKYSRLAVMIFSRMLTHYYVLVFDFAKGQVEYIDSSNSIARGLQQKDSKYQRANQIYITYVMEILKRIEPEIAARFFKKNGKVNVYSMRCPTQRDDYSCGYFSIAAMMNAPAGCYLPSNQKYLVPFAGNFWDDCLSKMVIQGKIPANPFPLLTKRSLKGKNFIQEEDTIWE